LPLRFDLKHGIAIDDETNDTLHVIWSLAVTRNDREQFLITPCRIISSFNPGRSVIHVDWKVTEIMADHLQAVSIIFGFIIGDPTHVSVI
jgi:hypothetical protein